ncbi:MAG: phosphotransferase [Planctomycetales bacterium]|nr:phosphotransferase [Planctomycetales bacterium]
MSRIAVENVGDAQRDESLPSLTEALNPELAEEELGRRLSKQLPMESFALARIAVLIHKPGRRCVIEYEARCLNAGHWQPLTVIGKVRAKRFGNEGNRRQQSLWDAGLDAESPRGIFVSQPLGTVPRFRMWLQRKTPGQLATQVLKGPDGPEVALRIAEAAALLHTLELDIEAQHTMDKELEILRSCLGHVCGTRPDLAHRVGEVMRACETVGRRLPAPAQPRLIHRDFYADQVIVCEQQSNSARLRRLCLLDFDLCCYGDPALDIGNFAGHLIEQSLREGDTHGWLDASRNAMERRFIERSQDATGPAVRTYTALTLARHIFLSTRFPLRRAFTEAILEETERQLEAMIREGACS